MNLVRRGLVVVRGAGDLATGCIIRLVRSGFNVVALETSRPSSIRRTVAFSEAIYEGRAVVEGITALRVGGSAELRAALDLALQRSVGEEIVPLVEDPDCVALTELDTFALIDAILAKRNLGTRRGMAPVVVALGPGFEAGVDVDAVIETNRGHDLGRVLLHGRAEENTGVPGLIAGKGVERVLKAPIAGIVELLCEIGDQIRAGDKVLAVRGSGSRVELVSSIDGVVRGLIRQGYEVYEGLKVADVDPRGRREHCFTVSDKSRAVAGGVLEALLMLGGGVAR